MFEQDGDTMSQLPVGVRPIGGAGCGAGTGRGPGGEGGGVGTQQRMWFGKRGQ